MLYIRQESKVAGKYKLRQIQSLWKYIDLITICTLFTVISVAKKKGKVSSIALEALGLILEMSIW